MPHACLHAPAASKLGICFATKGEREGFPPGEHGLSTVVQKHLLLAAIGRRIGDCIRDANVIAVPYLTLPISVNIGQYNAM